MKKVVAVVVGTVLSTMVVLATYTHPPAQVPEFGIVATGFALE